MPRSETAKDDRMHLRLDAGAKHTLERAAAYAQTNVSSFVLANALSAAERVIRRHEKLMLPRADWAPFFDALVNPPEPNETLRTAVRRYHSRQGG